MSIPKIRGFVHFFHDEKTEPKKSSQKQPSAGVFDRPTLLHEDLKVEVSGRKHIKLFTRILVDEIASL